MQKTTNYNLKKPESTDYVNISDLNDNADIVDEELKKNADALTSHQADNTIHITQQERKKWNDAATQFSVYKSEKDENGVFTVVEYKRADGTLYARSVLSGGTSLQYTTRTITYYAADGTTVIRTDPYTLVYDADGDLINEVKQ